MSKGDYWYGPDEQDRRTVYVKDFTPAIQAAGDLTQQRVAAVWAAYRGDHGAAAEEPRYASGWRPPGVNEATSNAAKKSKHLLALAGDVADDVEGGFAWWCMTHLAVLEQHGLWMEHPVATVVRAWRGSGRPWCHLQVTPPAVSVVRCYFPDARAVTEWDELVRLGGHTGMTRAEWQVMTRKREKSDDERQRTDAPGSSTAGGT